MMMVAWLLTADAVINLWGGGALVAWLLSGTLALPTRGHVFLWLVAVAVLGISLFEAAHLLINRRGS